MPTGSSGPAWLREANRRAREIDRAIGAEIRRLRLDAGISQVALARETGMSPGHLCDIEAGHGDWSGTSLSRLAAALGADLSVRMYPNTGPLIRDRHQAPMVEGLLRILHARWRPHLEVPVRRPARGVIDSVLDDRLDGAVVCVEAESDVRRWEQQVRWAKEKAESLPSSDLWQFITAGRSESPRISRLLLLRSTRNSRAVARELRESFRAAYPADPAAIRRALTTADAPWPGAGVLWVSVEGGRATILDRSPPGIG